MQGRQWLWVLGIVLAPRASLGEDGPVYPKSPRLIVALVEDPDFPPLDERLIQAAMRAAQAEYTRRFDAPPPTFDVRYRFEVSRFLSLYARPRAPQCQETFKARYRGTGQDELTPHRTVALKFLRRWSLEALKGFIPESDRAAIDSYEALYQRYADRYVATVDAMKALKTPANTPLIAPQASVDRSFVAWLCALKMQDDYDVVMTNTFILSDLLTEPHPHSVFGKAKVGGVATRSPKRHALGGQALLATTFGIDTDLPAFNETGGRKPTFAQRAQLLGAYILAHEIAHATFGIPDVYDHPDGCLMTSRPGKSYLDGLKELNAITRPCPQCQPYVQARRLFEMGKDLLDAAQYRRAVRVLTRSAKQTPKHFHGGRRRRLAQLTLWSSQAYGAMGRKSRARRFARLAMKLNPQLASEPLDRSVRTSSTSTIPRAR